MCVFCKINSGEIESKRKEVKDLLEHLRTIDKNIDMNIFRSMYNVNTDTAIAYQKDTVTYHFLDEYKTKVKFHKKEQFERTKMMFKQEGMDKIYSKSVAIFGVGGVGGYVAEMLARSGISTFYLFDPDTVNVTNINRQIGALHSTLGRYKVDVMKERILDINPNINIKAIKEDNAKQRYQKRVSERKRNVGKFFGGLLSTLNNISSDVETLDGGINEVSDTADDILGLFEGD